MSRSAVQFRSRAPDISHSASITASNPRYGRGERVPRCDTPLWLAVRLLSYSSTHCTETEASHKWHLTAALPRRTDRHVRAGGPLAFFVLGTLNRGTRSQASPARGGARSAGSRVLSASATSTR